MQSNLNRKQRMKCSMMYRNIVFCVFFLLLILSPSKLVRADENLGIAEDSIENIESQERAQILILHSEEIDAIGKNNLRLLTDMLSSMSKSVEYGTWSEYETFLSEYSYIICFDLDDMTSETIRTLSKLDTKLMFIGYDCMKQYLVDTNQEDCISNEQREQKVVMTYDFSKQDEFQTILKIDGITDFKHTTYQNGEISIGEMTYPLCFGMSNLRFMPTFDYDSELAYLAVIRELALWLWEYDNSVTEYHEYLVLEATNSYTPTSVLKEQVEVLMNKKLPFVISVMPVLSNADYPAMQQFCEVLKFAQANGGAVILHMPNQCENITDWDEFSELMTQTMEAYCDYGVYPLGMEVPKSWLYQEEALLWMRRCRTIFVYEDKKDVTIDLSVHKNLIYYNYHQLIMPIVELDHSGVNYSRNYASAYYIDCSSTSADELEKKINAFKDAYVYTNSLWDMTHSVWGNEYHLSYESGVIRVNDQEVSKEYVPREYEEGHDYNRNIVQRVTISIQNQSKELIIAVIITTVTFVLMILYARISNRNRLLGKRIKKKDGKE